MGLRPKACSYLTDDNDESKNAKDTKHCVIKRKLKYEDYKRFLEAVQLENKITHLNNNKIDVKYLIHNHKESIKNNKIILKSKEKFKSERHNVFTEEINKIALSSNDKKEYNQPIQ